LFYPFRLKPVGYNFMLPNGQGHFVKTYVSDTITLLLDSYWSQAPLILFLLREKLILDPAVVSLRRNTLSLPKDTA